MAERRQMGPHPLRISASAAFTVAVILFIVAAIVLSTDWPAVAKPVPLTACGMALTAAALNLVNELFGKEQAVRGNVDGGVATGGHGAIPAKNFGTSGARVPRPPPRYFPWPSRLFGLAAILRFLPPRPPF